MFRFQPHLRVISVARVGHPELEYTGRVLLPEAVLPAVLQRNEGQSDDWLFELRNTRRNIVVYAGVESFTAPTDLICIPGWMRRHLQVQECDIIDVAPATLSKATRALFQPTDSKFLSLPNPKVILNIALLRYPCLTQGSLILINFGGREYELKVYRTEPAPGVHSWYADVICEFAPPASDFNHRWENSDSDSSDDEALMRIDIGRTLKGELTIADPKPIRSTFAQREEDLSKRPFIAGVTRIIDGQAILPPRPKEVEKSKGPNPFQGPARFVKPPRRAATQPSKTAPKREDSAPARTRPAPPNPEEAKPKFAGVGRTLSGSTIEPPPVPGALPQKPERGDVSPFKGKPRTLREK
jgi:hypothetical protein